MWILSVDKPDQWKDEHVAEVCKQCANMSITFHLQDNQIILKSPKVLQAEDLFMIGLMFGYSTGLTESAEAYKKVINY